MEWEAGEGAAAHEQQRQQQQQQNITVQQLLDKNAEAVFKLNGLAMLRRQRSGEGAAPAPEERQLLTEAQRCLQEAAILLPPKVLMQPEAAESLRQHLAAQIEAEESGAVAGEADAAGQAAAAAAEASSMQRKQMLDISLGQQQQQLLPLHQHQQLQQSAGVAAASAYGGLSAALQQHSPLLLQQQVVSQLASPSLLPLLQQQLSPSPNPLEQQQQQQHAPAASQGSMPDLLGTGTMLSLSSSAGMAPASGKPGGSDAGAAAAGSSALGAADRRAAAQSHSPHQPQQGGQPPAMFVEPLAKEQMWLLSQAFASMTDEQKEKLAAQPPEVRSFVLQERMRKARVFEELVQVQRAAAAASGLLAQPLQPPAVEPWAGAAAAAPRAEGSGSGLGEHQQAALQQELQQQQEQQQEQGLGWLPQVGTLQPTAAGPGLAGKVPPWRPSLELTYSGSLQLRSLGDPKHSRQAQQQPQMQQQQQVHADGILGSAQQLLQAGGAAPLPPVPLVLCPAEPAVPPIGLEPLHLNAPFAAMPEEDRMKSMHQIRQRQQEWLEQQRRAAALLAGPGSSSRAGTGL